MADTDENFNSVPLFSFGIITDTHVRSPEGDQSSPYPVNDKANSRARYACSLLASQEPEFVVHLGDMVHPLPAMPSYDSACEEAISIFEPLKPNIHYVSGNHDVGDKPMPGSPAAIVNKNAMEKYSSWFGAHWYSFDVQNIRIVVINSSLINTGSQAEQEQNLWLSKRLSESSNYRLILFSHYPLFIHDPDEAEHYDNIAEPGRSWLLEKIATYSVEIVFSGHVHHFFYNKIGNSKFYTLASTSFTRQDYSELFKIGPAAEFGRDDTEKLSVAMVEIYPKRIALRVIGTKGIEQNESIATVSLPSADPPTQKNITVSMRHAWHESIDLPYNGPMEEFTRKRARNDYALLRLIQMGIHRLRIPLQDLISDSGRRRIEQAISLGFRLSVICLPSNWNRMPSAIDGLHSSIDALEYILPSDADHWRLPDPFSNVPVPVVLSYAASGAHSSDLSKPFAHTVSAGFPLEKLTSIIKWQKQQDTELKLAGIVVQVPWEACISEDFAYIRKTLEDYPKKLSINLKLAKSNPAEENFDEQRISERVCSAMEQIQSIDRAELQLDTFMSVDRGYSPRTGLVDRLSNLTLIGQRISGE